MKRTLLVLALMIPAFLPAQDAKLNILDQNETQQLKEAYSQYREAVAKWEQAKRYVASKYQGDEDGPKPCKIDVPDAVYEDGHHQTVRFFPKNGGSYFSQDEKDLKVKDCKIREGWDRVKFSSDFKAIVADGYTASSTLIWNSGTGQWNSPLVYHGSGTTSATNAIGLDSTNSNTHIQDLTTSLEPASK